MIGLLFDFITAGIIAIIILINIQFLTGIGLGRGFSIWKFHFRCDGEKGKKISYTCWKDEP